MKVCQRRRLAQVFPDGICCYSEIEEEPDEDEETNAVTRSDKSPARDPKPERCRSKNRKNNRHLGKQKKRQNGRFYENWPRNVRTGTRSARLADRAVTVDDPGPIAGEAFVAEGAVGVEGAVDTAAAVGDRLLSGEARLARGLFRVCDGPVFQASITAPAQTDSSDVAGGTVALDVADFPVRTDGAGDADRRGAEGVAHDRDHRLQA
eukprot:SAG22_NODE_21_length_31784_cov_15.522897_18_plen_207_part_00